MSGVKLNKDVIPAREAHTVQPSLPPGTAKSQEESWLSAQQPALGNPLPSRLSELPLPLQVQATVVGFLASIAAVVFGWIPDGHFSIPHAFLLCASSVATAFIASLVLGKEGREGQRSREGHPRGCQLCLAPSVSPFVC